ncbi:RHS repeat-associated core domain-containing protein [Psychromonas sp. PT13]|uniref:RHS repeat-associated core domain-containing protein n=1 Tax=Psychromonas sp. PT13 TaxID=3439547 RepID=UPI003EBE2376
MASAYKFHGAYGGSYIIATLDSESPANFEEIVITNYDQVKRFQLAIIGELNRSSTVPDGLYEMLFSNTIPINNYGFSVKDAFYKLVELLSNGKLRVFVDLPKNTGHKESLLEQAVGAGSDAVIVATTNKGADSENPNITNDKVNEIPTETSIENQVKCADPVSMLTGEEILELEDFQLNSLLPLKWNRIYRSSKIKENIGLGYGWRHGFSLQLFSRYDAPPKVGPKQPGTHWFELIDEEGRRHAFNLVKRGDVSIQGSSGLGLINESKTRQVLIRPDNTHWVFSNIDDRWLLTTINNEFGHELSLHYDTQHRLVGIETTSNRGVILYYNSDNNIIRIAPYVIDKQGEMQVQTQLLASYQYNDNQSLIAAINAQGNTEQYKYNKNSLLRQRTRASGFNHYFEWDSDTEKAKCTHQWGDDGTYDYHFSFDDDKSSSTNTLGHTEYFYHNDQDLLTCHVDENGNKTQHQYDEQKRKIKTTKGQRTTHYHYNQIGQLSSVVEADGSETHFIYNAFGKQIATIDALGRQFKRHYNATGRLLSETQPDGRVTEYKYNDAGHLSEKIDASGLRTLYKWNNNGELLAEQVGDALTRYSYDNLGHINAICDAQDLITEYQRNEQGQITRQVSYHQREATGNSTAPESALITHYFYDKAGRLTNITNPAGENTHYGYGGLAQPTKKVFADGSWLNYQYDKERNLIGIERSDEATYQIEYSPTEKPIKLVGFDGRVQTYDYDANDELIGINDADERIIHLKRDSLGRLIDQHSFTTQENKQAVFNSHNFYQYDKVGRVTLAHNSERVVQQQYHLNGQISQSKQGDWALDYQFNKQGQRSSLTLPDGSELRYEYDKQGQVTSLDYQFPAQQATQNLITRRYSNTGQLSQQALGNDITLNQTFDSFGRLSEQHWLQKDNDGAQQPDVKTSFNHQRHYTYDKKHQLLSCDEQTQSAADKTIHKTEEKQSFNYNSLSQLVQSSIVSQTNNDVITDTNQLENTDYQWDAFGNPKVDKTKPKAMRETRIELDRLLSFSGVDYRYDKSGNQISSLATGQIQKRSFDGLNQLRKINHNDKLSQYEYDALGRRSAKITEAGRTDFIWDGNQLIGEVSNGQYTWYIYLPDSFLPVALIKDNQVYYYHLDQLGTPICLTDSEQQVVWENQGDLFGYEDKSEQGILKSEKVNRIENPLRFQGQYFDAESGLHYNRFRYYCPKQGRFIHQDPIGLAGGINHYQYAPNPVNWVDPFGLCKEEVSGVVITGTIEPIVGRPAIGLLKYTANTLTLGIMYGDISSINALNAGPQDMEDIAAYIDSAGLEKYAMMLVPTNLASKSTKLISVGRSLVTHNDSKIITGLEDVIFSDKIKSGIPGINEGFAKWFNDLSDDQLSRILKNPTLKKGLEERIRYPGKMHEWLKVSQIQTFKRWGVKMEDIWELRTPTKTTRGINPDWKHGSTGSNTAHKELDNIIENSLDFDDFKRKLQNWANYRLTNGVNDLPYGLRN